MSIWLRKRLFAWSSVSLLAAELWDGGVLHAQDTNDGGERKEVHKNHSRDEVAKEFVDALEGIGPDPHDVWFSDLNTWGCISQKSQQQFRTNRRSHVILAVMAQEWLTPRKKVSVQSEGDKTATVVVGEDKEPKPLTLVLIEEDGTWGVDVLETYAKWHNLEGAAKAMAIYKLTGVELPELPVTGEFVEARENARRFSCQSNLKQIMLGIKMYAQDYDEKLPPAKQWIDVLQPYLKSGAIFNCPSVPKGQRYGYAYNAKLSQKNESILGESYKVVTLYETSALKRNAYGMGEGLTFRHSDGANYAFEDGHVKWLSKANVPSFNLGRTVAPSPAP